MAEITEAEFERMFDISVLVVDNDTTTLYIVAGILRTWGYKVVTATSGHEALKTLREFAGMFDLVITDLYMQGMNGFQLQNQIKREFQLPVILMSEDRRTSVMSKGLANGASFFIAKPVKKDDLRHVWQYVVAARKHKFLFNDNNLLLGDDHQFSLSSSSHHHHPLVNSAASSNNLLVLTNNDHDDDDDGDHNNSNTNNNEQIRNKSNGKRRCNNDNVDDEEFGGGQRKKPKVVWTTALHNRFLLAIRQIGMNKAVPKKILEFMNVPGLTRENVASHLQKYRIFLKKVAERGLIDGLSDRALRSRFATGLPIALIKSIKKSFAHHHHPYTSSLTTTTLPSTLTNNQYRLPPSNNYSNVTTTNNLLHNSPHHHLPKYHNNYPTNLQNHPKPQYHQRTPIVPSYNNNINGIINNGGFMTSANALVANGGGGGSSNIGMMNLSNYGASMGNHSYSGSYNNYGDNINKNGKALVPYGSSVMQRKNTAATATATAANYNSDYYPAAAASNYGNYSGIQLNNNASSFMATTTTGMDQRGVNDINGGFGNYMGGNSDNNISFGGGLINNNNNADKAAATVLNTATKENSNISVAPPILAEQTNIGITGNYNIAAGDDDDDQFDDENEWFIVNNPLSENEECLLDENFTDLFMMLDSMNLLNENGENGGGNSDEPLDFDFPTTPFDVEKCLQQFQGVDDEHVSPLTSSEGSSIAQPNKSPTSTDENSDKVLSDDGMFPNLDPIDWHLVDKANSSAAELDWDIDLIESLFGEGDLNKVAS